MHAWDFMATDTGMMARHQVTAFSAFTLHSAKNPGIKPSISNCHQQAEA